MRMDGGILYADFVIAYGNANLIRNQSLSGPSDVRYRLRIQPVDATAC